MGLLDLITGGDGNQIAEQFSQKFGISKSQMLALGAVAVPLIIGALKKNAGNAKEAENINNALAKDHDGSILNAPANANESEGSSILDHVFGGNRSQVEQHLSQQTGIDSGKIGGIMASLAPLVMGYIGKQRNAQGVNSGGGIGDLLGGILNNVGGGNAADGGFDLSKIAGDLLGGDKAGGSKGGGLLGSLFNMFKK